MTPNADSERVMRAVLDVLHGHVIIYSVDGMRCSLCGPIGGIEIPEGASHVHHAQMIAASLNGSSVTQ